MTYRISNALKNIIVKLRKYFFSGLLFLTPLILTIYFVIWFIDVTDGLVSSIFPTKRFEFFNFYVPGYGVLTLLVVSILIGFLSKGFWGRYMIRRSESFLEKMPIIRGLYGTIKQLSQAVLDKDSSSFKQVGLIEYPRKGLWTFCFITTPVQDNVKKMISGHDSMVNVFVPTTPNPTSGFLLIVPKDEIIIVDVSVEEGLKMVVSAGVIMPKSSNKPHRYN